MEAPTQKSRIIPVLGLHRHGLYKTKQFKHPRYVGDPINAVKVFNEKQVNELLICGFRQSVEHLPPDFETLQQIAREAFMPLGYGGGITHLDHVQRIIGLGFEKVVFNTAFFQQPQLIEQAAARIGSSSVVVSLDYEEKDGRRILTSHSGTQKHQMTFSSALERAKELGVGEIMLQSVSRDGMYAGFDLPVLKEVPENLALPLMICGGAAAPQDLKNAANAGVSGIVAGSLFVFYGKLKAVLINYPEQSIT
jgi:imidazole glycerol-phosphate synthase subunit HisF